MLYFYPMDGTPGCTKEACGFRDSYQAFKEAGAEVIGISSDTADSHKIFAGRHKLPFILLSDDGAGARKLYGVPATFGILPGRVTYVIGKDGRVKHIFNSQLDIRGHIDNALKCLQEGN